VFRLQQDAFPSPTNSRFVLGLDFGLDSVLQASPSLGLAAPGGGGMEGAASRQQAAETFPNDKPLKVLTLIHTAPAKSSMSLPLYSQWLTKILGFHL